MSSNKKKAITNSKIEKDTVKQIVNVRIGEQSIKKKRATKRKPRRAAGKPEGVSKMGAAVGGSEMMSGLGVFNRNPMVSLSLQSPSMQMPSYANEYNTLLKELAMERKQRLDAIPVLASNTAPLTTNMQLMELNPRTPKPKQEFDDITQRFANAASETLDESVQDDPTIDDNMLKGTSNLGYRLSQKLPTSNFDYEDVEAYDAENEMEQEAIATAVKTPLPTATVLPKPEPLGDEDLPMLEGTAMKSYSENKKTAAKQQVYEEYVKFMQNLNERYGTNYKIKGIRTFTGQGKIREEISRIQNEILMNKKV